MMMNFGDMGWLKPVKAGGNHQSSRLSASTVDLGSRPPRRVVCLREKMEERIRRPRPPEPFFLSSDAEIPEGKASRSPPLFVFGQTDVSPYLRREVRDEISGPPLPPCGRNKRSKETPRAETLQKLIHPFRQRIFNYRLIFLHDLSAPERASDQVLSVMKSDVTQATERDQTRRRQVTSIWLKTPEKAGKTTVQTVIEWCEE
ncbi:hypothetical protein GVN24_05020 [Rhizobium sp. CRIBSB]|nr:hypothetical protein [Rhizobium sp. CRIBSB]